MTNSITKRWQKKVKELQAQINYLNQKLEKALTSYSEVKAKLEQYEKREEQSNRNQMIKETRLEGEVEWLRRLVQNLVISPDVVEARTDRMVQMEEMIHKQTIELEEFRLKNPLAGRFEVENGMKTSQWVKKNMAF